MSGDLLLSEGRDVQPDLNVAALARRFRLPSVKAVYDRVRRGSLPRPSYRLGRTMFWTESDLDAFLQRGEVK